jgi:Uncharacterized protein conserved in bacteria
MTEFTAIVSVLIGLVIGFVAGRSTSRAEDVAKLHKELNAKRKELDGLKRDMTDHFSSTAVIMEQLDEQYQRLYQHMTEQSQKLLPQPSPFRQESGEQAAQIESDATPDSQPLDYSGIASGLLNDQKRTG